MILLFTALLIASRSLELSGLPSRAAASLLAANTSMSVKLVLLTWVAALSSAFMMNDASLFIYAPIALMVARYSEVSKDGLVVMMIMAANIGSSLTPIGNPQNLYVWRTFKVPTGVFISSLTPFVALAMFLLTIYAVLLGGGELRVRRSIPAVRMDVGLASYSMLMLILIIIGGDTGYSIEVFLITAASYLIFLRRKIRLNYDLIALFSLMVIDFETISLILAEELYNLVLGARVTVLLAALGLSQAISNVPATITLSRLTSMWKPLIIGADLGGLGVILGSLANMIGVRLGGISLSSYHKHAAPLFLALTFILLALSLAGIYP